MQRVTKGICQCHRPLESFSFPLMFIWDNSIHKRDADNIALSYTSTTGIQGGFCSRTTTVKWTANAWGYSLPSGLPLPPEGLWAQQRLPTTTHACFRPQNGLEYFLKASSSFTRKPEFFFILSHITCYNFWGSHEALESLRRWGDLIHSY